MLVQVAADHQHDIGHREVLPMTLRLAVSVAGSSVFELLLRMREAFVEVVEDLSLVRERAQLGRVVTAAESRRPSRRTSSG